MAKRKRPDPPRKPSKISKKSGSAPHEIRLLQMHVKCAYKLKLLSFHLCGL